MPRGKIHSPGLVDDRSLQQFSQLDKMVNAGLRARGAIGDEHRIFGLQQHPRGLGNGAGIARRRSRQREFRNALAGFRLNGISWSSLSATSRTGPIGGVMAIL